MIYRTMNILLLCLVLLIATEAFQTTHHYSTTGTALYYFRKDSPPDFYEKYDDENALHIPNRIGITTANWKDEEDATDALTLLVETGVSLVSCENSKSEEMLGRALEDQEYDVAVACSYNTRFKTGGGKSFIVNSLQNSIDRLSSISSVQLVQAKSSRFSLVGLNGIADGMLESIDDGNCDYVGMIDMAPGKLKSMVNKMRKRDDAVSSNRFEYSLANRKNEKWIKRCKKLGVIPFIQYPFGKDFIASGRWTSDDPIHKKTRPFSLKTLDKYELLHSALYRIANLAQGRASSEFSRKQSKDTTTEVTAASVALNYVIAKGGVPLVDVYNEETAAEVIGCLGWKLEEDEIEMLDLASEG